MKKTIRLIYLSIFEITIAVLVLYLSYFIRFGGEIPDIHLVTFYSVFWMFGLGFWVFMLIFGTYFSERFLDIHILRKIIISAISHIILIFVIILFINMYSQRDLPLSRWIFVLYFFILIFSILIFRTFSSGLIEIIQKDREEEKGLLMVPGPHINDSTLKKAKKLLEKHFNLHLFTEGDYLGLKSVNTKDENILNIIERFKIRVILFLKGPGPEEIISIINETLGMDLEYWVSPKQVNRVSNIYKLLPVEGYPYFKVIIEPIYGINAFLKRSFDVVISLILIITTLPLYLIIPVLIKLDSRGPVFFKQVRLAKNGKPFKIIKFRSMIAGAEDESGPTWAGKEDDRITKSGKFLRKFSLDEIPQLFLVLLGRLSFIGPRPERPYFVEKHPAFKGIRLLVKPGLTGLAQINGRYDLSLEEKLNYDVFYINNYSFWLDIEIFLKSIFIIISQKGAR